MGTTYRITPRTEDRYADAFKALLHEVTRYNERKAEGSTHPYDRNKVEGTAITLAACIREREDDLIQKVNAR